MSNTALLDPTYNFDYISKLKHLFSLLDNTSISEVHNLLKKHNQESIKYIIESLNWFLKVNIPVEDKVDFITKESNINFNKINLSPMDLLNDMICQIENILNH